MSTNEVISYQKQSSVVENEDEEESRVLLGSDGANDGTNDGTSQNTSSFRNSRRKPSMRRGSSLSSSRRRSSFLEQVIRRAFSIGNESIQSKDEEYEDLSDDNEERDQFKLDPGQRKLKTRPKHPMTVPLWVLLLILLVLLISLSFYWFLFDTQKGETLVDLEDEQTKWDRLKAASVADGLKRGAVAADHPLCSKMGLHVLQDLEGNAVDAAVAVALCLGVANPASSGMGGGAFMLIHADPAKEDDPLPLFHDARDTTQRASSRKTSEVIDCRERAPAAAYRDMYLNQPDRASQMGGLAIPIPGELRGLELAHARHGKLPWAAVVEPALKLAKEGVPVNPNLAHEIQLMVKYYTEGKDEYNVDIGERLVPVDSYMRYVLTKNDNWDHPLMEGDLMHNPRLVETLEAVREGGADALYKGERAANLARDIQQAGGIVTKEDIENYRATIRSPVVGQGISGVSVVGVPPPSSGGAAIIGALRFLSGFDNPLAMFADTLSVHRQVEASKHAFAIRMSLSDPAYNSETVVDAVRDLIEGGHMEDLRKLYLDNTTLPLSWYGGSKWAQLKDSDGSKEAADAQEGDRRRLRRRRMARRFGYLNDHGTSHFSIVDSDGNAVSVTTSINTYFGSHVYSPSTGVLLSSSMDDFGNPGKPNYFGLQPSPANFIEPGKIPLSSMSPTMVFREDQDKGQSLMLVLGGSGGPKIISSVLSVIISHIFVGMPLFESLAHPRVHDQLIYHGSAVVCCDHSPLAKGSLWITVGNRTLHALAKRGHRLLDVDYQGTIQAVAVDLETKEMTAACDVRKGGSPAGY